MYRQHAAEHRPYFLNGFTAFCIEQNDLGILGHSFQFLGQEHALGYVRGFFVAAVFHKLENGYGLFGK
jgi:hypothetical protein